MKRLSPTRNLCVRQRAHSFYALPFPQNRVIPPSRARRPLYTYVPLYFFPSALAAVLCPQSRPRIYNTAPFPQLNLHRARVPAATTAGFVSNGSIETRARTTVPVLTSFVENAPPIEH